MLNLNQLLIIDALNVLSLILSADFRWPVRSIVPIDTPRSEKCADAILWLDTKSIASIYVSDTLQHASLRVILWKLDARYSQLVAV